MKKTIILILTLVALTNAVKAQVQFSVGPGVGFNYAVHSSSESNDTYSYFGALVTSQIDMQFSRKFALLLWVDFYSDMSLTQKSAYQQYKYNINYFQLAPTLKYCIPGSPFYLYAGPGFGIKTIGTEKMNSGGNYTEEIPNMTTRIDFRFGAGYEFFLSNKFTLTPFAGFNTAMNEVTTDSKWQISALQAGLVLRYNFF